MKIKSINPHDQSTVGELKISTSDEISKTVSKARRAFENWKEISVGERCAYVENLTSLLQKNKNRLAKLITLEMGKPLEQSLSEVESELEFIRYYVKNGPKFLADETIFDKGKDFYKVTYEPIGS